MARAEHAPTQGGLPPGHPVVGAAGAAMGGAGAAPGHAGVPETTPGNLPLDPKSVISGELQLDSKLADKAAAGDTIFLVVRAADKPGPPLAVKKLTVSSWPLKFSIDNRDAMMGGTALGGKVTLSVRIDKDGDALSKSPGDVTGQLTLEPPSTTAVVKLDTLL